MSTLDEVRLVLKNIQETVFECKSLATELDEALKAAAKTSDIDKELEASAKRIVELYDQIKVDIDKKKKSRIVNR